MNVLIAAALVIVALLVGPAAWRLLDARRDAAAWRTLRERAGPARGSFDPDSVRDLPYPARRYFSHTIRAGAALHRAVEIRMSGELGLGGRDKPAYRHMEARQILAPPHGLVWQVRTRLIQGADGVASNTSWTRFWLCGLLPIVRAGGTDDHFRSAFGRVVAEAAIWAPATLLPGDGVRWTPIDERTARATVSYHGLEQSVDVTVDQDGRPTSVCIERWSNENPEREFRHQPFGGELKAFRDFGDYRLPTQVEGGNHFGTRLYFPFFRARVSAIEFPDAGA